MRISFRIIKADRALEEGDHARCISILSRAIALAPCNAELFKKRGDAYFQLNDFVSAIANYKRTISLSPSEAAGLAARVADAYYRSGRLFCAESRFEAALEEFSRASEFHPDGREYTMQRWVWSACIVHVFCIKTHVSSTVTTNVCTVVQVCG